MTEQIKEGKKHVYHNRWDNLVVCALSFRTIDPLSCTSFCEFDKKKYEIVIVLGMYIIGKCCQKSEETEKNHQK